MSTTYLVLGQDFDGVPLLDVSDLLLALWVSESLSDWVVLDFLGLHVRIGHLAVRLRHLLEILLLLLVVIDFSAPCIIAISHACGPVCLSKGGLLQLLSVTTHHRHFKFLIV